MKPNNCWGSGGDGGHVKLTSDELRILLEVSENEVWQDVQANEKQHANLKQRKEKKKSVQFENMKWFTFINTLQLEHLTSEEKGLKLEHNWCARFQANFIPNENCIFFLYKLTVILGTLRPTPLVCTQFHYMEESSVNILQNLSFYVPQNNLS